jgi:HSP20 family protein
MEDIMALMRWEPYREFGGLQDRINRLFSDLHGRRSDDDDVMTGGSWIPAVDIYRSTSGDIVLKAEVPGVNKDDLDLRVENSTLTLRGERRISQDIKEEQYHRVERAYGTFSRSFSLPNTVDTSSVRADFADGVLTVTMPIREEQKPKQIEVQIGG